MTDSAYPPSHHLLRDFAVHGERHHGHAVNVLPHQVGLGDESGAMRLGAVATLLDMTGAGIALAAVRPDWIATADLACHLFRPPDDDVRVTCRPLRVGSSTVIVAAEAHDASDRLCGSGRMTFARIPGSATVATVDAAAPEDPSTPVPFSIDGGTPLDEPVLDRCGVHDAGGGRLVLDKSPYVENSFGTVNGGVMAIVAEAAAVAAVGGGRAVDLQIHYLEQVRQGPVDIHAEIVRDGPARLCQTRVVDCDGDRLVAVADVIVA